MNFKEIITIATDLKNYVEKNKKFPATLDGYNYAEIGYIFAVSLNNLTKDVAVMKCKTAPSPTGANINEQIYPSDWKDQAKRIVQFVKQNGAYPNYVTTVKSKTKVKPADIIYAFARVLVWYATHNNTAPNYVTYNSSIYNNQPTGQCSNPYKSAGHSTSHCCDAIGQNNGYYCACHSVQEVIRKLTGKVIPQKTLASVMGTTTSGTGHDGIRTGFAWFNKNYGYNLKVTEKSFKEYTWKQLGELICKSNTDIIWHDLYKNKYGHYEVVNEIDVVNKTLKVQNSLGDKCSNGCYYGYVESRSFSTMQSYLNGISQKSLIIVTK